MQYFDVVPSVLGELTIACDGEHLTGLWLSEQKYFMANASEVKRKADLPIFDETRAWLAQYFKGRDPGPIPSVKMSGTEFRMRVWKLLTEIPYGQLTSYGELARKVAAEKGMAKMSSRAVGGAVGHNPISIIVPCHRVIGSGGSLTGFGGGIARKIELLKLEGIDVSKLSIPTRGTAL